MAGLPDDSWFCFFFFCNANGNYSIQSNYETSLKNEFIVRSLNAKTMSHASVHPTQLVNAQ